MKDSDAVYYEKKNDAFMEPSCYRCRKLEDQKPEPYTTDCKCLAVVWTVLSLRSYLEGSRFILETDCHALRRTLHGADATGELARWRLRFLEYSHKIVHRNELQRQTTATISRLPTAEVDSSQSEDEIQVIVLVRVKNNDQWKCVVPSRAQKKSRLPNI